MNPSITVSQIFSSIDLLEASFYENASIYDFV